MAFGKYCEVKSRLLAQNYTWVKCRSTVLEIYAILFAWIVPFLQDIQASTVPCPPLSIPFSNLLLTKWVITTWGTQNSLLSSSLQRQDHHLNLWALAIKGPSPTTLNVFSSYKVLPLESITFFSDLRSKKKKKGWGGEEGVAKRRKRSPGIYGDKMPGSGRVCGCGIDQRGMQHICGRTLTLK